MISKFLPLDPFFTKKNVFINFTIFLKYASILRIGLYCKFRLAQLCRVFADLVTIVYDDSKF